jgi:hypothetical protein
VFVWDRALEKVVEQPLVVLRPTGDTHLAAPGKQSKK